MENFSVDLNGRFKIILSDVRENEGISKKSLCECLKLKCSDTYDRLESLNHSVGLTDIQLKSLVRFACNKLKRDKNKFQLLYVIKEVILEDKSYSENTKSKMLDFVFENYVTVQTLLANISFVPPFTESEVNRIKEKEEEICQKFAKDFWNLTSENKGETKLDEKMKISLGFKLKRELHDTRVKECLSEEFVRKTLGIERYLEYFAMESPYYQYTKLDLVTLKRMVNMAYECFKKDSNKLNLLHRIKKCVLADDNVSEDQEEQVLEFIFGDYPSLKRLFAGISIIPPFGEEEVCYLKARYNSLNGVEFGEDLLMRNEDDEDDEDYDMSSLVTELDKCKEKEMELNVNGVQYDTSGEKHNTSSYVDPNGVGIFAITGKDRVRTKESLEEELQKSKEYRDLSDESKKKIKDSLVVSLEDYKKRVNANKSDKDHKFSYDIDKDGTVRAEMTTEDIAFDSEQLSKDALALWKHALALSKKSPEKFKAHFGVEPEEYFKEGELSKDNSKEIARENAAKKIKGMPPVTHTLVVSEEEDKHFNKVVNVPVPPQDVTLPVYVLNKEGVSEKLNEMTIEELGDEVKKQKIRENAKEGKKELSSDDLKGLDKEDNSGCCAISAIGDPSILGSSVDFSSNKVTGFGNPVDAVRVKFSDSSEVIELKESVRSLKNSFTDLGGLIHKFCSELEDYKKEVKKDFSEVNIDLNSKFEEYKKENLKMYVNNTNQDKLLLEERFKKSEERIKASVDEELKCKKKFVDEFLELYAKTANNIRKELETHKANFDTVLKDKLDKNLDDKIEKAIKFSKNKLDKERERIERLEEDFIKLRDENIDFISEFSDIKEDFRSLTGSNMNFEDRIDSLVAGIDTRFNSLSEKCSKSIEEFDSSKNLFLENVTITNNALNKDFRRINKNTAHIEVIEEKFNALLERVLFRGECVGNFFYDGKDLAIYSDDSYLKEMGKTKDEVYYKMNVSSFIYKDGASGEEIRVFETRDPVELQGVTINSSTQYQGEGGKPLKRPELNCKYPDAPVIEKQPKAVARREWFNSSLDVLGWSPGYFAFLINEEKEAVLNWAKGECDIDNETFERMAILISPYIDRINGGEGELPTPVEISNSITNSVTENLDSKFRKQNKFLRICLFLVIAILCTIVGYLFFGLGNSVGNISVDLIGMLVSWGLLRDF